MKKGEIMLEKTRQKVKKNHAHYWKGKKFSKISRKKKSESLKKAWKEGRFIISKEGKRKISEANKGEKNHGWRGGITLLNRELRTDNEYHLWRKAVYIRDNFTCQKTKIRGGKLVAHHINNFADFPELRYAIDNGITLSQKAHIEFHKKYGKRNNTREQLEEFLIA